MSDGELVIDRSELPEVVPDGRTVLGTIRGNVTAVARVSHGPFTSYIEPGDTASEEWSSLLIAAAKYLYLREAERA